MSYTVLARRYRSETFDTVIGQEAVGQTLKNAIASDRVAHAYLFTGTRGVGKTTMARILAKALNCLSSDKPTVQPCCRCESCIAINEGEDIDVLEIDGASNTGVEHIRELRQNAIFRPARSRFKIYIIDEVHMLSVSAFNALLKTLEEPPEHVKFILATTEPNKILATILSRCQRFDFRNIRTDDIAKHLKSILKEEKVKAEDILVRRVARLARGSMRDALSLLDQLLSMSNGKLTLEMLLALLGTPRSERILELTEAIGQSKLAEALLQVDGALRDGLATEQLAEALQEHFRDVMILRNCGEDTELVELDDKGQRQKAVEQCELFDDATLVYNITVMEELRRLLKSSGAGRALLEAAVVRLTTTDQFSDTKTLLEKLEKLQVPAGVTRAGMAVSPARVQQTVTNRHAAKKNTVESDAPAATTSSSCESTVPKTISWEFIRDHWQDLLAQVSDKGAKGLVMYLHASVPTSWEEGELTLQYPYEQKGMLEALRMRSHGIAEAEKAFTTVLEQPVKLQLVLAGRIAENTTSSSTVVSPGAKPSQQEIQAAKRDPVVVNVEQILGGKVREIVRTQNTQ